MSRRRGRSSKNLDSTGKPIPGGGTTSDIAHLSRTLGMTTEAVEAMMSSQGAGTEGTRTRRAGPPPPAPVATSSAWADFMSDELGSTLATATDSPKTGTKDAKKEESKERKKVKEENNVSSKSKKDSAIKQRSKYKLPIVGSELEENCLVAQTGTLDSAIVGRGALNLQARNLPKIDLFEPTLLFPKTIFSKIRIGNIAASPSSSHIIAVDVRGGVYGWGRNEDGQLGLGSDTPLLSFPRKIPIKEKVQSAAVGKHHTILIAQDGAVLGCGKNSVGQLGINSSIDSCNSFRRSMMVVQNADSSSKARKKETKRGKGKKKGGDEGTIVVGTVTSADGKAVKFVQAACGEQFSVILSETGQMYTTGSSEFGQLGNGATGEHFITANKIGFANCSRFEPRTNFFTSEEKSFSTGTDDKKVHMMEEIRISYIACGKNHAMAVEAPREGDEDKERRVFSWGCGDYGCLGHGVQADEFYPRQLVFFKNRMFSKNSPTKVSCGGQCSLILTERGHGYYFGRHKNVGDAAMRPALMDALASNGHIVTSLSSGAQSIICCTKSGVTVTWGSGPYGELGYGINGSKSSSKPQFVSVMDSCIVTKVRSGYGCSVFLIRDDDEEDKKALKKLQSIEIEDVEEFDMASMELYKQKHSGNMADDAERNLGKRKQTDSSKGEKKAKN